MSFFGGGARSLFNPLHSAGAHSWFFRCVFIEMLPGFPTEGLGTDTPGTRGVTNTRALVPAFPVMDQNSLEKWPTSGLRQGGNKSGL